jgi:hypothetical protein
MEYPLGTINQPQQPVKLAGFAKKSPSDHFDQAFHFFNRILPEKGLRCAATISNGVVQQQFEEDNQSLAQRVLSNDVADADSYHACATFNEPGSRKAENVAFMRSFWVDIDVGERKGYATRKDAATALLHFSADCGLLWPLVVQSGRGIHAYWIMDADMTPDEWLPVAQLLKGAMASYGLKADPSRTADPASLLRPPGTHHRKADPILVKQAAAGQVDTLVRFSQALRQIAGPNAMLESTTLELDSIGSRGAVNTNNDLVAGQEFPPSSAMRIADECAVMRLMRDTRGNVDQPTWYHSLGVLAFTVEGDTVCHDWSGGHPQYSEWETDRKIRQARQFAPTTCAKLSEDQPALCKACPHFGKITSPISLGYAGTLAIAGTGAAMPAYTPLTSTPRISQPAEGVAFVNQHFGYTPNWGGQGTYFRVTVDDRGRERISSCKPDDFVEALAPCAVEIDAGGETSKKKRVPLATYWRHSSDRRTYEEVVFDPAQPIGELPGRRFNRWRGLAITPGGIGCGRMLAHLFRIICRRDRALFAYLLDWLAAMVQRPETRAGTALVFLSEREGTGKSTVAGWFSDMFGDAALDVNTSDHVVGKHNGHLEETVLLVINEALFAGDRKVGDSLKSLITDPRLTIEPKYRQAYQAVNRLHIVITTNHPHAVPAGNGARRFVIFEVDESKAGDHAYFEALHSEAENGGKAALLRYLKARDISKFRSGNIPVTAALQEQQLLSAGVETQWAMDLAEHDHPDVRWGQFATSADLQRHHAEWARSLGKRPLTSRALGLWLGKLGISPGRAPNGSRDRGWNLPAADQFLDLVKRSAGIRQ